MPEALTIDEFTARKVREAGFRQDFTFIPEPEAEPLFCPIISPDDHALEPPTLFQGRVPAKYADRVPRIVDDDNGMPWWNVEGASIPLQMVNGASGRPMDEWDLGASSYDRMRRGVWDPAARLHDMDMTGVWASLCFGSVVWGFAGTRFSTMSDPDLGLACLQAYNDWMVDEWCATSRDRYIPCQMAWMRDAENAAKEIYRNAARGFRAVSFSENPEGLGFPNVYDRFWDPFFAACEETETVVNLHVGSSGTTHRPCSSSHMRVSSALFPVSGIEALIDWVFSGVAVRFPRITVALSEAGASWVPMALERLWRAERQAGLGEPWPADAPSPQELVHRNFVFTSIEDPSAFRLLDVIGEDSVMCETDYPHYDSTWPESQAMIRSELTGLPAATIRKVCYENAARIYRHPLPPDGLIAASEVGLPQT